MRVFRLAVLAGLAGLLGACGWDSVFFTPRGFDPTEPPVTRLTGSAPAGSLIEVLDPQGRVIAQDHAAEHGAFDVALSSDAVGENLRLIARLGPVVAKVVVPMAPRGERTEIGSIDGFSTALAQISTYEIVSEAGSSFRSTPPRTLFGLLEMMRNAPTPALQEFVQEVQDILQRVERAQGISSGPFDLETSDLSEAFVLAIGEGRAMLDRYRAKLAAAARGYALEVRCDPVRLNVVFAVDLSGRARDGNGIPQLIRQPIKEGRAFLGLTFDESSPVRDETVPRKLTPNDPNMVMSDDGAGGDEVAGDGVYTVTVPLPRGARVIYKYTDGSAGEGFTGTEEWPGNARILEVEDVLTGRPDGEPDCLAIRRDSFGDEAANKNFVNLNDLARGRGGALSFETDLGGTAAPLGNAGVRLGGLTIDSLRDGPGLTPEGIPEARENGVCAVCPAPLVLDPDDATPPAIVRADRISTDRVRVRFSEPLRLDDARSIDRYRLVDDAERSVAIHSAVPSGAEVVLRTEAMHPRNPATLSVARLRDASFLGNELSSASIVVGPDLTAPKILSLRSMSRLDLDPSAHSSDPTRGDLIEVRFDEGLEVSAASDPRHFVIAGLEVLASVVVEGSEGAVVHLLTEVQEKGAAYVLRAIGLRDAAGNAIEQEVSFEGFALYRVTFGTVPGFAYANSTGSLRGIPGGEKLYLTGTPLASARDLEGKDISVTSLGSPRTDVTGWPQFELSSGEGVLDGMPIYEISVLLPKGSWAWKVAHGVEGEHARPPRTLEKVAKALATTNDATGVRVDPRPGMVAQNGLGYAGAFLSETGDEPPRSSVIFKREAPDDVCDVSNRDVACPISVVGTWRDLDVAGRKSDYDDGVAALPLHHPTLPDVSPPKLLDARARDSESILLSFDEKIVSPHASLQVEVARVSDGFGLPPVVLETSDLKPHHAVVRVDGAGNANSVVGVYGMLPALAYTVRYRGATDVAGHKDLTWRVETVLAPETWVPFAPIKDTDPPRVLSVVATDLDELIVRFDERVEPRTALAKEAYLLESVGDGNALAILEVELRPDHSSVRLATAAQRILEPYTLSVAGIADAADPANILAAATVEFLGFGEREPPRIERVRAISSTQVLVRFDEALDEVSAGDLVRYSISELAVVDVTFSGAAARKALAFNSALALSMRNVVLLTTSQMTAGHSYTLEVDSVRDLSGNAILSSAASVVFDGVISPPNVDVLLEVEISDSVRIAGRIPSRAISRADLSESREGVFVLGARSGATDNAPVPGTLGPVNDVLGGFPAEGAPLYGLEARMVDHGTPPDQVAGDGIFALRIPAVPLGTTILWKAFAPYSTIFRDQNPLEPASAFADALPGPSVFGDGQEYPGNENAAVILDDGSSDGVVRVRCLFGDEVTYKKHTGGAAFAWVVDDHRY